jgi:hypothetical protein
MRRPADRSGRVFRRDDLHGDACGQSIGGGAVPQVVQPGRRQVGFADELVEQVRDRGRMQRATVGVGEHQAGVRPCGAEVQLLAVGGQASIIQRGRTDFGNTTVRSPASVLVSPMPASQPIYTIC